MVEIPRSSFIPRESPGMVPARVRRKRTLAVFDIVATAMLIGSLVLAGVAYLLKTNVESQNDKLLEEVTNSGGLVNQSSVAEIREFDLRLRAAEALLANHVSALKVFAALEKDTKSQIQYTNFNFDREPGDDAFVTISGGTEQFKTLALQSNQYGNDPLFQNVIVTGIQSSGGSTKQGAKDESTTQHAVTFSVAGNVSDAGIRYDGLQYANTVPQQNSLDAAALSQPTGMRESEGAAVAGNP